MFVCVSVSVHACCRAGAFRSSSLRHTNGTHLMQSLNVLSLLPSVVSAAPLSLFLFLAGIYVLLLPLSLLWEVYSILLCMNMLRLVRYNIAAALGSEAARSKRTDLSRQMHGTDIVRAQQAAAAYFAEL